MVCYGISGVVNYHLQVRPSLQSQLRLCKFARIFFPIVPLLTSAIDVSDEIIAKLYTIDATRGSRMAMQNFRIGRKISHKFEAEKADLLTKIDRKLRIRKDTDSEGVSHLRPLWITPFLICKIIYIE